MMKRTALHFLQRLVCVVLLSGFGLAQAKVQLQEANMNALQEGKGWRLVEVVSTDFETKGVKKASASKVYLIDSIDGIDKAPFSADVKEELLNAYYVARKQGDKFFVAIEANIAEQGLDSQAKLYGDITPRCSMGWERRAEEFPQDFDFADSREWNVDLPIEGQDSAYIKTIADVNLNGVAKFIVNYEVYQTIFCVPVMFRYVSSAVAADLQVNRAGFLVEGEIAAEVNKVFETEMMKLIDQTWSFMVGPIPVMFNLDVPLSVGLETYAMHRESFLLDAAVAGDVSVMLECFPNEECTESHSFDFRYIGDGPYIDANAQAAAKPYLDIKVAASLYNSAAIGAWASAQPYISAKAWGYAGNTCGDGNLDGVNEAVYGATVDVGAGLHLFGGYDLLNIGEVFPIFEDILDFVWWDYELVGSYAESFYQHLLFQDILGGNSTVLDPILNTTVNGNNVAINYGMRACLPFRDMLTMSVDWGDGNVETVDYSLRGLRGMNHQYAEAGNYTVRVTALTDALGRQYNRESAVNVEVAAEQTSIPTFLKPVKRARSLRSSMRF